MEVSGEFILSFLPIYVKRPALLPDAFQGCWQKGGAG